MKTGVFLIQLGTPSAPEPGPIRSYLRQFLWDRRVLSVWAPLRAVILFLGILPFRPRRVSHAYKLIWSDRGSPLFYHTQDLAEGMASVLGDNFIVRFGMRYGEPSIKRVLHAFKEDHIDRLIVVPMYPHYASSSFGSSLEQVYRLTSRWWNVPSIQVLPAFHGQTAYLDAVAKIAEPILNSAGSIDHVLFSYHGLPEDHVTREKTKVHCLQSEDCCDQLTQVNSFCYRAQCMATTRAIVKRLSIADHSSSFQSRVGSKWIQPFTDKELPRLAEAGVKNVVVFSLSFTADCLETLEEIQIRGRDSFVEAGGTSLTLVPALNAEPEWVESLSQLVRALAEAGGALAENN